MRTVALVVVVLATLLSRLAVQATECNVKDYGAEGDGKSNDTDAFVKCFQACASKDVDRTSRNSAVNTVLVPPGTFLVWPLDVKKEECSDLLFNITGLILAPRDPASWFHNSSYFKFDECQNFEIGGGGKIDGQGESWWKIREKDSSVEAPVLIVIENSENVAVRNISLSNSPFFHIVPKSSKNVLIDGITIKTPESSPNTDGIDPSNSHNVTIRSCFISTGDDNVAIKPGSTDILVENCTFGYGHGCSIGSINSTGVQNVLVSNVVFVETDYGARIKTWQGGSGLVQNITYQHLEMRNVDMPMYITMYYCPHSQHHSPCKNSTKGGMSQSLSNVLLGFGAWPYILQHVQYTRTQTHIHIL